MMLKRRWLAPLGAILFGILMLVLVEVALRLLWTPPLLPGEQLASVAIDPFEVDDGMARTKGEFLGAMRATSFSVPKKAGIYRIFCIGGSTTLGYPIPAKTAWPSGLERRLALLFPERSVEVINVGGTSYGSARTLGVLRGLLAYQPDLVIIATGDAEFVEDSFRVAVADPAPEVTWLHTLYLSRAMKQILPGKKRSVTVDAEDQSAAGFLFAPAVNGTVYRVDPGRRSTVMQSFTQNLRSMADAAQQAGVPVIMSTLPSNVAGWPPDPDPSLPPDVAMRNRWVQLLDHAKRRLTAGDVRAALDAYAAATEAWSGNATVCYEYGQLLVSAGKIEEGRSLLQRAVDLDPTPVRATSEVNATIRLITDASEVVLADTALAFERLSGQGLPGDDLILDYAHPTPLGHVEMARTVLRAFQELGQEWRLDAARERVVHQSELDSLTAGVSIDNANLSFALGQVFERKGLSEQALKMYQQAIDQGYQGPFADYNMARVLTALGHYPEALTVVLPLVEKFPDWNEPYGLLGYLYQQLGEIETSMMWFQQTLDAGEQDTPVYLTLGGMQLGAGLFEQARKTLEEGLKHDPDSCAIAGLLGRSLEASDAGRIEAELYYQKRLATYPQCHELSENLGLLLMQQQRWREAEAVFVEALRQPMPLDYHHLNLGYIYLEGFQDHQAAARQFAAFLLLQPESAHLVPAEFRGAAEKRDGR